MSDDTHSDSSDSAAGEEASFNLKQITRLGALMEKFDLSEVRLRRTTDAAEENWTLRRGSTVVAAAAPVVAAPVAQPAPAMAATPAPAAEASDAGGPAKTDSGNYIFSPTVGTFYSRPSPDDPTFVKPGDSVSADTIVCLIEAMKVFNQIPADTTGKIKRILLSDGDAVEHGQPMFELE